MNDQNNKSFKRIEELLEHILAIQLYRSGVSQQLIAKRLKIATSKANELLKGVEKSRENEKSKPKNS